MSEYVKMEMDINCKEDIIAALEKMKELAAGNFEYQVHDEAVHLQGYRGDTREQTAEIVVPRQYVGGAANDLGFKFNKQTGKWEMIISSFDKGSNLIGTFKQLINMAMIDRVATKKMMKVEVVGNGPTSIKAKQQIKLRLT